MKTMTSIIRQSQPARQGGSVLIEMAAVIMLMMVMTAGLIQFGRVFWHYNVVAQATRNAARYLSRVPATELSNATKATAARAFAKSMVVDAAADANVSLVSTAVACLPSAVCSGTLTGTTISTNINIVDSWLTLFDLDSEGNFYDAVSLTSKAIMPYTGP
jgi:Flp pilus assembly protein TadG